MITVIIQIKQKEDGSFDFDDKGIATKPYTKAEVDVALLIRDGLQRFADKGKFEEQTLVMFDVPFDKT